MATQIEKEELDLNEESLKVFSWDYDGGTLGATRSNKRSVRSYCSNQVHDALDFVIVFIFHFYLKSQHTSLKRDHIT